MRFLGYSGLSHLGFILLSLYAEDKLGFIVYQIVYIISIANVLV
jgi:NADH:ubiquinone oxidoreductase subunit 2 (subunit N)